MRLPRKTQQQLVKRCAEALFSYAGHLPRKSFLGQAHERGALPEVLGRMLPAFAGELSITEGAQLAALGHEYPVCPPEKREAIEAKLEELVFRVADRLPDGREDWKLALDSIRPMVRAFRENQERVDTANGNEVSEEPMGSPPGKVRETEMIVETTPEGTKEAVGETTSGKVVERANAVCRGKEEKHRHCVLSDGVLKVARWTGRTAGAFRDGFGAVGVVLTRPLRRYEPPLLTRASRAIRSVEAEIVREEREVAKLTQRIAERIARNMGTGSEDPAKELDAHKVTLRLERAKSKLSDLRGLTETVERTTAFLEQHLACLHDSEKDAADTSATQHPTGTAELAPTSL
jgi:hypothetical protein